MEGIKEKEKLIPNKSKSYLLPLLDSFVGLKYVDSLLNTYLFYGKEDFGFPIICLLYKFDPELDLKVDGDDGFIYYEEKLYNNKYFLKSIDIKDCTLFIFRLPEDLEFEYACLLEGMYSAYREENKRNIVKYLTKNYRNSSPVINRITLVLQKSPLLRKRMGEELAVRIPTNMELSSKIDVEKETFTKEIVLNNL